MKTDITGSTSMLIRKMEDAEIKYAFNNSDYVASQCGFIGNVRIKAMHPECISEWLDYSYWSIYGVNLRTKEFELERDFIINEFLGSNWEQEENLRLFCEANGYNDGFRVDTEKYTYLFRINPHLAEYNVYCFCYLRERLDNHMRQAAQNKIRIVDANYKEIFRVEDGDSILVIHPDGIQEKQECRFIDLYHFEIDHYVYHILEFAEKVKKQKLQIQKCCQN